MNEIKIDNLTIYNSIFEYINSNMYVLIENNNALVIDPHKNNEVFNLLKENNIENIMIILTHEHPDHISGVYWLQQNFNCKLICSQNCADYISQERNVRPLLITFVLEEKDRLNNTNQLEKFNKEFVPHTYKADITYDTELNIDWCNNSIKMFSIQGHSKGSSIINIDDKIIFSGDSLLKELPVIVRFPGGNKKQYIEETLPLLEKKLNSEMYIMPGHGKVFKLDEIIKDGKINVEFR